MLIAGKDEDWRTVSVDGKAFGAQNWPSATPKYANYRGLGLADMARNISERRPHRANGDVALHVLSVMSGMLEAAVEGRRVGIAHTCDRPYPLAEAEARMLLVDRR